MAGDHLKEIFLYLVKHGANIDGIDPTLGTPLMLSIREGGDDKLTRWLVEQGANVAVVTQTGTAVHNACEHGSIELIDFLLKHGGDKVLNVGDARDFTPLTVAAQKGRNDVIRFLVKEWKADVNYMTDVNALFMAVQYDNIETVKLLIELGANVNLVQEKHKCYPLHLAASNNFLDIVDLLIKNGAVIDCPDHRGFTPLFMASAEGYNTCVEKLIKSGANVNHRSMEDYTTAIYHAVNSNRLKVVRLLLEHGADPLSTRNDKNQTLAEIARINNRNELANLLEAWVSIPPEERSKICANCCKYIEGGMKRCGKCKARWFCSVECQKKDWTTHKLNCHPSN
eukprot:TRINITY_DN744_c1_g3_i1.p1 TRINITY_DN744_c1_g3~~TRINITY_DN744_c1_g3_i1.p1  ORF type:complete len:400 (-),score=78.31 TRINITY_DN744_c1_g3_i1:233-1252(-)